MTPHQPQEDIFGQLDNKLKETQTPSASSLKIGDRDYDFSDPAAIQKAILEMQERNQREIDAYKQIVNERERHYVQPEENKPSQQQQLPQQNWQQQLPPSRQRMTVEEFVEHVKRDPQDAQEELLARALGLNPGVKASDALKGMLAVNMGMAQRLEQMEKDRQAEAQQRANAAIEQAGVDFVSSHQDYEPSEANSRAIEQVMNEYGLGMTARNLDLAYREAVNRGSITPKQVQQQPQGNPGLPSFGRSNAVQTNDMDFSSWNNRLNQLPTDQALKILRDLYPKNQDNF